MLLKKFQPLDDGLVRGQKIQHFNVEAEAIDAEADRDEQQKQQPAAGILH